MKTLKYYIYRFKWHIAPYFKYGLLTHLDIELNTSCNQKCISCWHSDKKKKPIAINIKRNKIYHTLLGGSLVGIKSVKFNLRGEPLLSKDLLFAIKSASKLGYIDIMINTNGVLLTKEKAIELENAGLTTCIISVDSLSPTTYSKLHGCDYVEYTNLMSNLKYLGKYKKSGLISFKIKLNFHVNQVNKRENFKRYKEIFPFDIVIRHTENREGENISINRERKRKKSCPHMKRRITMTADGNIYPCCVCYNEPQDIYLAKDFKTALSIRKSLIDNYKKGCLTATCLNCTSGDIYK